MAGPIFDSTKQVDISTKGTAAKQVKQEVRYKLLFVSEHALVEIS